MFDLKRKMKLLKIINLIDSICFDKKYNKFDLIIEVSNKKNNEKINKIIYLLRDINILYFKFSFNKKIKYLLVEYIKLFNKNRNTDCDEESLKKIIFKLEKIRNENKLHNFLLNKLNQKNKEVNFNLENKSNYKYINIFLVIKFLKFFFLFLSLFFLKIIEYFLKLNIDYLFFKIIEFNGPVFIKIFQHIIEYEDDIPFLKNLYRYKNNIKENISYHNSDHSCLILKKYNLNIKILDKTYKSGSMGQVIKCLYNNKLSACKVIHPNIRVDIFTTFYILEILVNLFGNKYNIRYDEIYKTIVEQSNFKNEADNMIVFSNNFKNIDFIKFPKIFYFNNECIISEFVNFNVESTLSYNDIREGYILYNITFYHMLFIDNYIHGDLHTGNWKIIKDSKNKFKIVFFDTSNVIKVKKITELRKLFFYNIVGDSYNYMRYLGLYVGLNKELIEKKIKIIQEKQIMDIKEISKIFYN